MLEQYICMTDEQRKKLDKFYDLHINAGLNLTAIKEREEFNLKHYLDSIYIFEKRNVLRETMVDIGSGGGFPGIIAAIFYPKMKVTLVESIAKKCRFLEQASEELCLKNITVRNCRAEDLKGSYDLITARGVAKIKEILKWTKHLSHSKTIWLLYKGEALEEELKQASDLLKKYNMEFENVRVDEPFKRTYTILGNRSCYRDGVLYSASSSISSR